jgi:hypothetical protein
MTALVGNKISYRLIWAKLPKGAVRYAEAYFPAGSQSINTWERNSKYRDMHVGLQPLFNIMEGKY